MTINAYGICVTAALTLVAVIGANVIYIGAKSCLRRKISSAQRLGVRLGAPIGIMVCHGANYTLASRGISLLAVPLIIILAGSGEKSEQCQYRNTAFDDTEGGEHAGNFDEKIEIFY